MEVLFSWIGAKDLAAAEGSGRLGPVADSLLHLQEIEINRAVLMFDHARGEEEKGKRYLSWLNEQLARAHKEIEVILRPVLKESPGHDPTAYSWVFDVMRTIVSEETGKLAKCQRHYLLGPGTSTMVACTLAISRMTACAGRLWQPDERGEVRCRPVELPFDLVFQDAPDPAQLSAARWMKESAATEDMPVIISPVMQKIWSMARRAAVSRWPILITGSTGTGKEVLARFIHESSGLKGPFLAINCGAIPENLIEAELFGYRKGAFSGAHTDHPGLFEAASGGTVFLDELGELPLSAQVKFLRVLQEGKVTRLGEHQERTVDCRFIAATHRDLKQAVRSGQFREDLYYRLAGIIIALPDLRERPEDLAEMIQQFWRKIVAEHPGFPGRQLSEEALRCLMAYHWPGNVRELRTTLVRVAFLAQGPLVSQADVEAALGNLEFPSASMAAALPAIALSDDFNLKQAIDDYKRSLVELALQKANGNQARAARMLGISAAHLGRLRRR